MQDQFDTIDLSDNEIVKLENFPYLSRLGTLLLNNNRITRINPNIGGKGIDLNHSTFLAIRSKNKGQLIVFCNCRVPAEIAYAGSYKQSAQ